MCTSPSTNVPQRVPAPRLPSVSQVTDVTCSRRDWRQIGQVKKNHVYTFDFGRPKDPKKPTQAHRATPAAALAVAVWRLCSHRVGRCR